MSHNIKTLKPRDIRYWCCRLHTESTGGSNAVDDPNFPTGVKEHFEKLPWFPGWTKYSITWDVNPDNPLDMIPLKISLVDAWNQEIFGLAKDLPTK
jgi:hypothetical protein